MHKSLIREPKKPYLSPILTVYGTVQELTRSAGTAGQKDGGTRLLHTKTHIG
jgi:hypothetical protein